MQEQFRSAIDHTLDLFVSRFGDRLKTVVLEGSVAWGEALAGVSDVDLFAFTTDEPTESDMLWRIETKEALERDYPFVSEFSLEVSPVDVLRRNENWRFIIKHNSTRLYGTDIIAELEAEGISTPQPTKEWLKSRVEATMSMWSSVCDGEIPEGLFKTPDDPFLASRKIARFFVLVQSAYLLMLDGEFLSFRQGDVLRQLRKRYPEWKKVCDLTELVSRAPRESRILPAAIVAELDPFMRWMIQHIREA